MKPRSHLLIVACSRVALVIAALTACGADDDAAAPDAAAPDSLADGGGGRDGDGGMDAEGDAGSGTGAGPDSGSDAGKPHGDADAGPGCTHFKSPPTTFTHPVAFPIDTEVTNCTSRPNTYITTDLTGDGWLDLVVTWQCSGAVGISKWLLYPGSATGFAAAPTDFAIPFSHDGVNSDFSCGPGKVAFREVIDMTGDGRPDLVEMSRCEDTDPTIGRTRWLVYPGAASGFGAPTNFAIPEAVSPNAFTGSRACGGGGGTLRWTTRDLDGDGNVDLVVTSACDDATVGATKWRVHPGSPTGFAAAATDYAVPSAVSPTIAEGTTACSASENRAFTLFDLDGDGRLDLVVTHDCNDVGKSRWQVYRGTASGFAATAADIALPAVVEADRLRGDRICADGFTRESWSTFDLNADGRPDLVVTAACNDATVGASRWLVHPGTPAGFGAAVAFDLPFPADRARGSASCTQGGGMAWVTRDYTRDGRFDLVSLRACGAGASPSEYRIYACEK